MRWVVISASPRPSSMQRPARTLIHASSSLASARSTSSRAARSPPSSPSRIRTSAPAIARSPIESSASMAWARTSGSSDRRQRRMTPRTSGAPSTASAPMEVSSRSRCRTRRTATRNASGPWAPAGSFSSARRPRWSAAARSRQPRAHAATASSIAGSRPSIRASAARAVCWASGDPWVRTWTSHRRRQRSRPGRLPRPHGRAGIRHRAPR